MIKGNGLHVARLSRYFFEMERRHPGTTCPFVRVLKDSANAGEKILNLEKREEITAII
jgi:hypothetical protein